MFSKKKLMAGLIPVGLVAAVAAVAMAVVPAGASAAECRVLTFGTKVPTAGTCNEPPSTTAPANLRDDATTPEGYGTDGLAVNTNSELRFCATVLLVKVCNKNPAGYAFFGLKLDTNEVASNNHVAKGWVEFADVQHASPSAVFSGTGPSGVTGFKGGHGPWPISVRSDLSTENPGKVAVENVHLLFQTLGAGEKPVTATGTFTGVYAQPGANCPAGGVKLNIAQPEVTLSEGEKPELDNGAGGNAYLCFVSANNYLFPSSAPSWALTEGTGIWKD